MKNKKGNEAIQPSALDAEENLLSALFMDSTLIEDISLEPEAFYSYANRFIFEAVKALVENQMHPDVITIKEELLKHDRLEEVGGVQRIINLMDKFSLATQDNVKHYADMINDKWVRRKIIDRSREIAYGAMNDQDMHHISGLIESLKGITCGDGHIKPYMWLSEIILECAKEIEQIGMGNADYTGLKTGYCDLDALLGGLRPGNLIIIAGRPTQGKTSLATNFATNMATVQTPVIIFSIESTTKELVNRIIFQKSKVNSQRVNEQKITPYDWQAIEKACNELCRDDRVCIRDINKTTTYDMTWISRTLRKERGAIGAIIVDYLQLMASNKKMDTRNLEIASITRELKGLAKDMECPVIVLSQLNRAVEDRTDKMPKLSDLRDSGAIEQDADIVLFIHRPEEKDTTAMIKIAKNRNGPKGTIKLTFLRESFCFCNYKKE